MAKSKFEYVKHFELDDRILPATYIVVRIDGRGFSKFTDLHSYIKPNDARGLALMVQAAAAVMKDWGDIILAFGESDEFSFVFAPHTTLFGRRASKLATGIVSQFAANFVYLWPTFFPDNPLRCPPSFDARCVAYPSVGIVSDYFKWRQVDSYINSMYNEAFWALQQRGGKSAEEAHAALKGTLADAKHEILHSFGINYAKLPAIFRRGSTLVRVSAATPARWLLIEDAVGEGAAAAVGGKGAKAGKAGKVKSKAVASTADCAVSGAGAAAGAERGGLTAAAAAPCSDAVEGDSERMAAPQRQAVSESGHDRCTDAARACSSSPAGSSAAAAGPDDRGAVFGAARPLVAETASASTSGPPSLASGDSGPRPGVATAPVTHNSSHPSADRGAEASAHDAGDAGLPDTDAGTALGALAMPSPSILLCFPDYNRGSFLARLFAAHPQ